MSVPLLSRLAGAQPAGHGGGGLAAQGWSAAFQAGVLPLSSVVGVSVVGNILSWADSPGAEFAACLLRYGALPQLDVGGFPLHPLYVILLTLSVSELVVCSLCVTALSLLSVLP